MSPLSHEYDDEAVLQDDDNDERAAPDAPLSILSAIAKVIIFC